MRRGLEAGVFGTGRVDLVIGIGYDDDILDIDEFEICPFSQWSGQ